MGPSRKHQKPSRDQSRGISRRSLVIGSSSAVVVALAAGVFTFAGRKSVSQAYTLAEESALPDVIRKAPPKVREAYRFAIANREILRQIPCYCGCGAEHKSNAECYIKNVAADGKIEFDLMSYG